MAKNFNGLLIKFFDNLPAKQSPVRLISYNQRRDLSNTKPNIKKCEEMKKLNWFYNHHLIDISAAKPMVKIHPSNLLFIQKAQDAKHLIRSAQYLQKELPIRISHRINGFRHLPFIVACNPTILAVHELYIRAFYLISEHEPVLDLESEKRFSQMLRRLLDAHKDVVTQLAEGFRECRKYIENEEMITYFLDDTLTSRLGMRILVEHHLELHDEKPNHIGIINTTMRPKDLIEKWCLAVKSLSEHKYSRSPDFKLNGHLNCSFPYIETALDYIIPELLKNSVRATVESHIDSACLPPITITIANNARDFVIRISDRGGGMPEEMVSKILKYHYSTVNESPEDDRLDGGLFGSMMRNDYSSPMAGFGFGLPTSRAYAEYLSGSLTIVSMHGTGTDIYLRLKHINGHSDGFKI